MRAVPVYKLTDDGSVGGKMEGGGTMVDGRACRPCVRPCTGRNANEHPLPLSIFHALMAAGLGEHRLRDLNDQINKLLREKFHWQRRIKVCLSVCTRPSSARQCGQGVCHVRFRSDIPPPQRAFIHSFLPPPTPVPARTCAGARRAGLQPDGAEAVRRGRAGAAGHGRLQVLW